LLSLETGVLQISKLGQVSTYLTPCKIRGLVDELSNSERSSIIVDSSLKVEVLGFLRFKAINASKVTGVENRGRICDFDPL